MSMNTAEAFAYIAKHPEVKVKCKLGGSDTVTMWYNANMFLHHDSEYTPNQLMGNIQSNTKWEVVQEPVTFMEAVNSGKKIRHGNWGSYQCLSNVMFKLHDDYTSDIARNKLNEKAWFIEPEREQRHA